MLRKGGGVLSRALRQSGAGGLGLPQVCFGAVSSHSIDAATMRLKRLLSDHRMRAIGCHRRSDMVASGPLC